MVERNQRVRSLDVDSGRSPYHVSPPGIQPYGSDARWDPFSVGL
jgi:hypothetical protein